MHQHGSSEATKSLQEPQKCYVKNVGKTSIEKVFPTRAPRSYYVPLPHFWISEGSRVLERFFKGEALENETDADQFALPFALKLEN